MTYTALIYACGTAGDLALGLWVLDQFEASGAEKHISVYNCVIKACVRCGDLGEASAVLERITDVPGDLQPNVVTLSTMMDGYADAGLVDKCYECLEHMSEQGIEPNIVTYTCFFKACSRAHQPWRAREVVSMMAARGCAMNARARKELRKLGILVGGSQRGHADSISSTSSDTASDVTEAAHVHYVGAPVGAPVAIEPLVQSAYVNVEQTAHATDRAWCAYNSRAYGGQVVYAEPLAPQMVPIGWQPCGWSSEVAPMGRPYVMAAGIGAPCHASVGVPVGAAMQMAGVDAQHMMQYHFECMHI